MPFLASAPHSRRGDTLGLLARPDLDRYAIAPDALVPWKNAVSRDAEFRISHSQAAIRGDFGEHRCAPTPPRLSPRLCGKPPAHLDSAVFEMVPDGLGHALGVIIRKLLQNNAVLLHRSPRPPRRRLQSCQTAPNSRRDAISVMRFAFDVAFCFQQLLRLAPHRSTELQCARDVRLLHALATRELSADYSLTHEVGNELSLVRKAIGSGACDVSVIEPRVFGHRNPFREHSYRSRRPLLSSTSARQCSLPTRAAFRSSVHPLLLRCAPR